MVILEILRLQPGMAPVDAFLLDELAEEPAFRDPVDLADHRRLIARQRVERLLPRGQQKIRLGIAPAELRLGAFPIRGQDLDGPERPPVRQRHLPRPVGRMGQ